MKNGPMAAEKRPVVALFSIDVLIIIICINCLDEPFLTGMPPKDVKNPC